MFWSPVVRGLAQSMLGCALALRSDHLVAVLHCSCDVIFGPKYANRCMCRVNKAKRPEDVVSKHSNQGTEVPSQQPASRVHHKNDVQEISKTTRFYVPSPVPATSEHLQLTKTMTDPCQDMTASHKFYIPKVFSSR